MDRSNALWILANVLERSRLFDIVREEKETYKRSVPNRKTAVIVKVMLSTVERRREPEGYTCYYFGDADCH